MTLLVLIEALKIHKLKEERRIQWWFIGLYIVNVLPFVLPVGDRDFSALFSAYDALIAGKIGPEAVWTYITADHWLHLGLVMGAQLVTAFFAWMYAVLYIGEQEKPGGGSVIANCLKSLPRLLVLFAVAAIPAMMSAFFLFIPVIVFGLMMYLLPLKLAFEQKPLMPAIKESMEQTRGRKLSIFGRVVVLSFLVSIPQSILVQLAAGNELAYAMINSFFVVIQALAQGRLMGIIYKDLVRHEPLVLKTESGKFDQN